MKLKSIHIMNMHNVEDKTYDLSEGFTYFLGPNGAGKSTILEAIQLVILGYIPGYAKTNEAIMKHSSSQKLEVSGTFDDGSVVTRRWSRSGSSVSSEVETIPTDLKLNLQLVDDKLELPIYNFAEFKDLTANKLKEWFISFLPPVTDDISWETRLKESLKDRAPLLSKELLDETLAKIAEFESSYKGVELVKQLNTYFKSEQSFAKKEIDRLESTVQNLVYYEEELPSSESVRQQLDYFMGMLQARVEHETSINNYNSVKRQLDQLNITLDDSIQSVEEIDSYVELRNVESNTSVALKEVSNAIERFKFQIDSISNQIAGLSQITDSRCPYTSKECNEITLIRADNLKKIADLSAQKDELERIMRARLDSKTELDRKLFETKEKLHKLASDYTSYFRLRDSLRGMKLNPFAEIPQTKEEINVKIKECQESLSKIEANKKYNELIETITSDKYRMQNNLEVLKIWERFTGANGLQTELMTKPFEAMSSDMSKYLTEMFGQITQAHFNLVSKANSFSFGLIRKGEYIEFDYLSSGERCLFMLAIMICILNKSNASLRTILVDDLIDHLDDYNANNVYIALNNVEDVQFILAGVKTCSLPGVVSI